MTATTTGLAALALAVTTAAPASAWTDAQLSWSACGFFDLSGPVHVQVDPGFKYPDPSLSPEGHASSYPARIQGAVNTWNGVFANAPRYKHNVEISTGRANPEVVLRNTTPVVGGKTYLGYTYTQRRTDTSSGSDFYTRCPYKSVQFRPTKYTRIETEVRADFFTQGNEWRGYWENCTDPQRAQNAPYSTCSKQFDFEALMAHELGHALGQAHPSNKNDSGAETTPTESAAAKCYLKNGDINKIDNATMCPTLNDYRSSQRVLEDWDVQAFYRHTTIIP